MRGWEKFILSELALRIIDCEHKTAPTQEKGFPSIRTPNIGKGRLLLENVNRVSEETYKLWTRRAKPKYPDLILAREAPLGNVAIIPKNLDVCLGQRTVLISPDLDKVDPSFLCYRLLSDELQNEMNARGGGSTVPHLNVKEIRNLPITIPPLPTQRRIASILSAYDDLIENNLKRIKLLEGLAQRTHEEWFVKFTINGKKLEVNQETGLPEGWERRKLGEVVEINKKSLKKGFKGKIKYVDIASVSTGNIDSWTEYNFEEAPGRARRVLRHGDTIWSCVRPNRKSFSIIWEPIENLIGSTGFAVLSPKRVSAEFLYFSTTTETFVGYLSNRAGGAAYPAVTSSVFEEAEIVIPPNKIERDFSAFSKEVFSQIYTLKNQNRLLKESRDILLPRLMSGAIKLSESGFSELEDKQDLKASKIVG